MRAGSGVRKQAAVGVAVGMLALGHTWGGQAGEADKRMLSESERIVSPYKTVFTRSNPKRDGMRATGGTPSRTAVDGPLLGNGDLGVVIGGPPEAQHFYICKSDFWRLQGGHRKGGGRLFGGLDIKIPALAGGTYLVEQQLYPAITTSTFKKGEATVTMRSFVAATANFLVVELSVTGMPVDVEVGLWADRGSASGRTDSVSWVTKSISDQGVEIPVSAACGMNILGAAEPAFKLQPAQTVTVAVAMKSSFDVKDPPAAAREQASQLNSAKAADLLEQHKQWWREFWAKSLVEIGDPVIEQRYYLSNYVMASTSRNPEFPPGLFGIWVTTADPAWGGDYHLNYNFQAAFYGLYSCNHLEQADPYDAPILAFMDTGRDYAKKFFNIRGVYYPVGIGPKGIQSSIRAAMGFCNQRTDAAYCLANMAMRWYHTYNLDYAKKVYPFVVEVANFWEDYLTFEPTPPANDQSSKGLAWPGPAKPVAAGAQGRYVIYDDSIHENCGADFNSLLSLGLVRCTFELAVDMSTALGGDAGRQAKWQHILKNLSQFPTQQVPASFCGGELPKNAVPAKDDVTVFRYSERGLGWRGGNTLGIQHIFPAGAIGLDSDPKMLEIARNTIRAMSRWRDNNGMNSFYPAAVRVGYDPGLILKELREMMEAIGGANGFTRGNKHGVENCSIVPNTINEMLCMGHGHVLRVFPVWPKDKDARFMGLRTWNAFLVSSSRKGGAVQYVKITSERGRDCTLVNPWPGKAVDVYRDGKKVETLKGDRAMMKTEAGATVVLTPEGAGLPVAM